MRFIKQLKLFTLQVILSLVFLNTQISFAQQAATSQITNLQKIFLGVNINNMSKKSHQKTLPIIDLIKLILMMMTIFHYHLQNIFLIKI